METLEYWQEKLVEFEDALTAEKENVPEASETMIRLLSTEIRYCKEQIEELS